MGSTLADQFTKFVTLSKHERKILLLLGISAGFASVFGTPIAGALFAIEVLWFSNVSYKSIFLSFTTAFFAYFTVSFMPVVHTHYAVAPLAHERISWLAWALVFGVICGLIALLFSKTVHLFSTQFTKYIPYPPLRPVIGGITLVLFFYFSNEYKYAGLGIPTIVDSFKIPSGLFDCILKLILTCFTLACGFKGGEVTPLFFIGATLGSSLSGFIPMPISLLAAMGFVAVFSGATHTPIACTAMGMELFGWENGIYIAIACFFSYLFSGTKGIYRSQQLKGLKSRFILKYL
jgi:H+/Cl- antiporter ClcA